MTDDAVTLDLQPSARRQLGEAGLLVLWREGPEPGRREGLACTLSVCPVPLCVCENLYVDGYVLEGQAGTLVRDREGVHLHRPAGAEPARTLMAARLKAIVDPSSGETWARTDEPLESPPEIIDWLASEMDGELLDALDRYLSRAKGHRPERQRSDIDIEYAEEGDGVVGWGEFFEGSRVDRYVVGDRHYSVCLFLCPYFDCDCHRVRVAFLDDDQEDDACATVGSVLLDLGGAQGMKIVEQEAQPGAPDHLIRELWERFQRRHDAEAFLRQREARMKAVGQTLWKPAVPRVDRTVRAVPKPGRNDPCPCGSGRKYKKCCLDRDDRSTATPPEVTPRVPEASRPRT